MMDSPLRILAIDDDEETLELLSALLGNDGYAVTRCATAEQALELVTIDEFDVAVSDVHLHGMDGIRLCSLLTEMHPRMPVIMVTAFGDDRTRHDAVDAGAFEFVQKPVDFDTLTDALHRAELAARPSPRSN